MAVVHSGEHVNFLVLFVEQVLEFADLALELADAFLERLGVAARKGAAAEFVAGAALEADVGALRACRAGAVAANLFAAAPVAGLGDAALRAGADFDDLHGKNAGHLGRFRGVSARQASLCLLKVRASFLFLRRWELPLLRG